MTRVLVVHHDLAISDQEADGLRRVGYDVEQCQGPIGGHPCPIMRGLPCPAADRADVLVYDAWAMADSDRGHELISHLRDDYPGKPVVLTSPGLELEWVETEGPHRVVPLVGVPTTARLHAAIEEALGRPEGVAAAS
ncbi:MAG TPA: hypothetical protein VF802_09445 [Candidatus Limnocylindrales bacterium]